MEKDRRVLPVQIIEQVVRKTLEGESVSYVVKLPDKNSTVVDLDKVKAEIFSDENQARERMTENTLAMIEMIIRRSVVLAGEKFSYHTQKSESVSPDEESNGKNNINISELVDGEIELEGGVRAKIRSVSLPEGQEI
jgi:hypothetical protein|tara:strand:+ start:131 stop:541 length:411 start_codon:yes stop_codon:yes gene_type:complete